MNSIFDIFKIGIGPSSSHTMGPMTACNRIINTIKKHQLLNDVETITVELFGSLAYTGKSHGTDKALIAGFYGFKSESIDPEEMKRLYKQVKKNKTILLSNSNSIPFDFS